jgi:uncharacterized membrane protein YeaQ/YmgE (transglycosylase-associated protein family)
MMNIIITLVVGAVIGWVASMIMKTNAQMGMIANIVVGIVGSFLGYWIAGLVGMTGGGIINYVFAVGGAVILLAILKMLNIFQ